MIYGLAIDPGPESSGYARFTFDPDLGGNPPWGVRPLEWSMGTAPNEDLVKRLNWIPADVLVVEVMLTLFNLQVAAHALPTERWTGRFIERFRMREERKGRDPWVIEVSSQWAKASVLGQPSGNNAQVRQALIQLYGGKDVAFGKRCPCRGLKKSCAKCNDAGWLVPRGPFHGVTGPHAFRALACVIAAFEPGQESRERAKQLIAERGVTE